MNATQSNNSDPYPVFPNGPFISRFYTVSSQESGLNHLDIDLFNECYLPYNPLSYHDTRAKRSDTDNPDYQIDSPPCKRQATINSNCYFTWNGTLESIDLEKDAEKQQSCFCSEYPFFDAVGGCQACFEKHGGIEGYHWFPSSYISAASATYCSAAPLETAFYPFVSQWAATAREAQVASTTAADVLGTSTAASLYYTPTSSSKGRSAASINTARRQRAGLFVAFILCVGMAW